MSSVAASARDPSPLRVALAWLPPAAYTGLIWFLSSRTLDVNFRLIPFQDKGVHFVEYGVLCALLAYAVRVTWPTARYGLLVAFWLTVAAGMTDEFHQAYVPGRSADTNDLVADALGALIALTVYRLSLALLRRAPATERPSQETPPA